MEQQRYHQFATVREDIGDKVVVHVFGEVDLSCSSELEVAIDEAAAIGMPVVVNFEQCCYMDSSGLTALIRGIKRNRLDLEAVIAKGSPVERLMRITHFDEILQITPA